MVRYSQRDPEWTYNQGAHSHILHPREGPEEALEGMLGEGCVETQNDKQCSHRTRQGSAHKIQGHW